MQNTEFNSSFLSLLFFRKVLNPIALVAGMLEALKFLKIPKYFHLP